MRTFVLPVVALVWGAAILINGLVSLGNYDGAYGAGRTFGMLFGVVLVAAGGRALLAARQGA